MNIRQPPWYQDKKKQQAVLNNNQTPANRYIQPQPYSPGGPGKNKIYGTIFFKVFDTFKKKLLVKNELQCVTTEFQDTFNKRLLVKNELQCATTEFQMQNISLNASQFYNFAYISLIIIIL